jgi:uncharacterized iron-regulated membrane protein
MTFGFAAVREPFLWLHRWSGLLATVVLIIEGATGALLAFTANLAKLFNPALVR